MLNDPNGALLLAGPLHLFYQGYPPEDPRVHWGHGRQRRPHPLARSPLRDIPRPERDCYSGAPWSRRTRVIAMYTGHRSATWSPSPATPSCWAGRRRPVSRSYPSPSRAARRRPIRCSTPASGRRTGSTTRSPQERWSTSRRQADRGRLPLPLGRPRELGVPASVHRRRPVHAGGRRRRLPVLLADWRQAHPAFFSHMSGGQYLLGDYDKERDKLVVTSAGLFNFGAAHPSGVHAPRQRPTEREGSSSSSI